MSLSNATWNRLDGHNREMAEPELVRADARLLCVRSLLTVGAFLAVAVACRLPNREFITRDQLGRAWPFTVASGTLYCERQGNHVVFESGGNHYAINGSAKGAATKNGYLAVDAIPQPLPGIGQRTKAALQAKRARGGARRYGAVRASTGLGRAVTRAVRGGASGARHPGELRAAGYSLRQVAAELNRQGFTTRRGTAWKHQFVARLAA